MKTPLTHMITATAPRPSKFRWISAVLLPLALSISLAGAASAQPKIALVDLRKVFDDYYKRNLAHAKLQEQAADLEKEAKALADQYQKATDDYKKLMEEANNQAISSGERESRKKAAENKLIEINELKQTLEQYNRTARGNLDEQTRRMRENILVEIRSVITAKAKEGGYSMVLDTAAESLNRTPIVLYTNGQSDITEAVLTQLNATAPPGTLTPSPDKKDEKKK